MKNRIKRKDCIKRGAWTVCRFNGGWSVSRKRGWKNLNKLKGKKRPFLEGPEKGATLRDLPPKAHGCEKREKISPFMKFEVIRHLFSFFLHLLTDKLCKAWINLRYDKFLDRFQDISKVKNYAVSKKGLAIT